MKHVGFRMFLIAGSVCLVASGCKSLKPGECENDTDCKGQVEGLGVCYKEPADVQLGKCVTVGEAREALERYERKQNGTCEDKDGDGVKAGDACDPPVDCNDNDPAIKPGSPELCDSRDNNCNELVNEGLAGCIGTLLGGKQEPVVQFSSTMTAAVAVGGDGLIYVSDEHRVYRSNADKKVERIAGSNEPGNEDRKGTRARLDEPRGMAVAVDGTVYVAECRNNCIRKIAPDGQVTVFAGLCSNEDSNVGQDALGDKGGARFWCPSDVALDAEGALLVADLKNAKIKRIKKDGVVELFAGKGGHEDENGYTVFGYANGPAPKAEFDFPTGLAVGKDGMVYVADAKNNCIRTVHKGMVGTLAGRCGKDSAGYEDGPVTRALFSGPQDVAVSQDGAIWVADTGNHCIRRIQAGKVEVVAGKCGLQGYADGPAAHGLFNQPRSIAAAADGTLYVVDHMNYRVRTIRP